MLRYREENRLRGVAAEKNLLALFTSATEPSARQELQRWLADLMLRDFRPSLDRPGS
jgi:hypothetical protein